MYVFLKKYSAARKLTQAGINAEVLEWVAPFWTTGGGLQLGRLPYFFKKNSIPLSLLAVPVLSRQSVVLKQGSIPEL